MEPDLEVVKLLLVVDNLEDVVEKRNDELRDEEEVLEELLVEDVRDEEVLEELEELEEGGTHGEPVHWLVPGPLIMTHELLRH